MIWRLLTWPVKKVLEFLFDFTPTIEELEPYGRRQMFRGARRGDAWMTGVGTAVTLVALVRRFRGPSKERLVKKKLKPGRAIAVRLVKDGSVVGEQVIKVVED